MKPEGAKLPKSHHSVQQQSLCEFANGLIWSRGKYFIQKMQLSILILINCFQYANYLVGSPPKSEILSWTQARASWISRRPWFPENLKKYLHYIWFPHKFPLPQNMTPHLPREQGINKAGKHYKTSLRRLVAFRFLTLLLELVSSVFFSVFFSSMWMTRDIFDHLNFQSFKSSPWSVRWKESKGAQPVVDGDNHHVFIHHHLWSETSAPVLKKFF